MALLWKEVTSYDYRHHHEILIVKMMTCKTAYMKYALTNWSQKTDSP